MKIIVYIGILLGFLLISGCLQQTPSEPIDEKPDAVDVACQSEEDCIPAQCCHPTHCISKNQAPDCSEVICTTECRKGTMDCGGGECGCVEGICKVIWDVTGKGGAPPSLPEIPPIPQR